MCQTPCPRLLCQVEFVVMVERDRVGIEGCLGWRMRPCLGTWEGVELQGMVEDLGDVERSRAMTRPLLQLPLPQLESLGGRCIERTESPGIIGGAQSRSAG